MATRAVSVPAIHRRPFGDGIGIGGPVRRAVRPAAGLLLLVSVVAVPLTVTLAGSDGVVPRAVARDGVAAGRHALGGAGLRSMHQPVVDAPRWLGGAPALLHARPVLPYLLTRRADDRVPRGAPGGPAGLDGRR